MAGVVPAIFLVFSLEGFVAPAIDAGASFNLGGQLDMHPGIDASAPVQLVFPAVPAAGKRGQQLLVLPPVQAGPLLLAMGQADNIVFICLTPVSGAFPAIQPGIPGDPQSFPN